MDHSHSLINFHHLRFLKGSFTLHTCVFSEGNGSPLLPPPSSEGRLHDCSQIIKGTYLLFKNSPVTPIICRNWESDVAWGRLKNFDDFHEKKAILWRLPFFRIMQKSIGFMHRFNGHWIRTQVSPDQTEVVTNTKVHYKEAPAKICSTTAGSEAQTFGMALICAVLP